MWWHEAAVLSPDRPVSGGRGRFQGAGLDRQLFNAWTDRKRGWGVGEVMIFTKV